jgi:Zn-dependent protease
MRTPSFLLGRIFGVEVRIHSLFLLFLVFSMTYSAFTGSTPSRGFALWLLMLLAVLVREAARAMAFAWGGIKLERLVLLPTGAIPTAEARTHAQQKAVTSRAIALAGPLANFAVGITLALLLYTATASVNLFTRPWVTPAYLLRSLIWTQVFLGGLHLIPAFPLDAGATLRKRFERIRGNAKGARAMAGISQMTAFFLVLAGLTSQNLWLMVMGAFLLAGTQMDTEAVVAQTTGDSVSMQDVMLTDFTTLSASDTLEQALERSVHSLQDIFPVVRGPLLVGAVSRQTLSESLRVEGNGYVQGVMARTFPIAAASDALGPTLARIGGAGAQMVPVVEDDRVLGIVTPQSLSLAMHLLGSSRRLLQRAAKAGQDGE